MIVLEARSVRWRAAVVLAGWTALALPLVAGGVVATVLGASGQIETPRVALVAGPAVVWIGLWVWTCAWIVWTYRREVPALAASEGPYDTWGASPASRHAAVTMEFTLRALTGVDLHGLPPTASARFVNGPWPLVGHAAAFGLCVIGAAIG